MPLYDEQVLQLTVSENIETRDRSMAVEPVHALMERLQRDYLDSLWRYVFARCDADVATVEDVVAETYSAAWAAMSIGELPKEPWPIKKAWSLCIEEWIIQVNTLTHVIFSNCMLRSSREAVIACSCGRKPADNVLHDKSREAVIATKAAKVLRARTKIT